MIYTKEWAEKMLEMLPDAQAIAMDRDGEVRWYDDVPKEGRTCWIAVGDCGGGYLGKFDNPEIWQDSLVVRKWRPKAGDTFYYPSIWMSDLCRDSVWDGDSSDLRLFDRNLICRTKEEAIEKCKRMLEAIK